MIMMMFSYKITKDDLLQISSKIYKEIIQTIKSCITGCNLDYIELIGGV